MSLTLQRADAFIADFEQQARWYVREANEAVARRYLRALESTLLLLCGHPGLGRIRRFRHPQLRGIRSFRVEPPFDRHLIFYRYDAKALYAERVMHGSRDLPRRLREPPEQPTD
jgi:plasmid stabilization system protein ParE